jgi:hypothetical protein
MLSQIHGRPHALEPDAQAADPRRLPPVDCSRSVPRGDSEITMKNLKGRALPASSRVAAALAAMLVASSAQASMFTGETLDSVANGMAWFILIIMPPLAIGLFWMVHILPEKIAEKRHHPNKDAINVLCLLSLVFGGMLWPIAWLWAYTRPLGHKLAYGTEKHEDYYVEQAERHERGELNAEEVEHLRDELEQIKQKGQLTPELKRVHARLTNSTDYGTGDG